MLKPKTSLLQIRIEPELLERLKRICDAQGMPVSYAIRKNIENWCEYIEQLMAQKKASQQHQTAKR